MAERLAINKFELIKSDSESLYINYTLESDRYKGIGDTGIGRTIDHRLPWQALPQLAKVKLARRCEIKLEVELHSPLVYNSINKPA